MGSRSRPRHCACGSVRPPRRRACQSAPPSRRARLRASVMVGATARVIQGSADSTTARAGVTAMPAHGVAARAAGPVREVRDVGTARVVMAPVEGHRAGDRAAPARAIAARIAAPIAAVTADPAAQAAGRVAARAVRRVTEGRGDEWRAPAHRRMD